MSMDLNTELNLAQYGLNELFTTQGSFQKIGLGDLLIELASGVASDVTSFNGRNGAVVAVSGDYNTSQVTEASNLYFTNARVLTAPLTGYVSGAGVITAADSVLSAIQKLNGNIAFDLAESLHIDGTNSPTANINWNGFQINNLATPTSPQDAATKNYVDTTASAACLHIDGSNSPTANINWAGFQLNNVALNANSLSILGLSGVLKATAGVVSGSATTSDLPEGSNLYYLDSRARAAISSVAPVDYNPVTGVVSMHVADSTHDGFLSQSDWNRFNAESGIEDSVTTPDNIPVAIYSAVLPNTSVWYLEARVTARYVDGSAVEVFHKNVGVRAEISGSPSIIAPGPTTIFESNGVILSVDWVINGSSVELQVTGDASKSVNWKSFVSVYAQND